MNTQQSMERTQPGGTANLAVVKPSEQSALARLNMRELRELSEVMVASGAFADVRQSAQAMVKILAGAELGFSPIVSVIGIHFFNGKVTIGANLQASLIKESKKYDYEITEHTNDACSIQFFEIAGGQRRKLGVAVRYTIKDAATAGLASKDNWKKYPQDMLFAACLRQGTRRYCADVLRGMTAESDTSADEVFETTETVEVDGETVDTTTGEIIDPPPTEDAHASTTSTTNSEPSQKTAQQTASSRVEQPSNGDSAAERAKLLKQVFDLLKQKCGDGEVIDEDASKAFLKDRDPNNLGVYALQGLIDALTPM